MRIDEITDITRATPVNRQVFKDKTDAIQRVESLPEDIVEEDDETLTSVKKKSTRLSKNT